MRTSSQDGGGSDLVFIVNMPDFQKTFRDRGTILAMERGKLLKYSHWSEASRLPDTPDNRTMVTLCVERAGEKTSLTGIPAILWDGTNPQYAAHPEVSVSFPS